MTTREAQAYGALGPHATRLYTLAIELDGVVHAHELTAIKAVLVPGDDAATG